jgi:hypothetical protein
MNKPTETAFSRFVREASNEEKEKVFAEVLRLAELDQQSVREAYRKHYEDE